MSARIAQQVVDWRSAYDRLLQVNITDDQQEIELQRRAAVLAALLSLAGDRIALAPEAVIDQYNKVVTEASFHAKAAAVGARKLAKLPPVQPVPQITPNAEEFRARSLKGITIKVYRPPPAVTGAIGLEAHRLDITRVIAVHVFALEPTVTLRIGGYRYWSVSTNLMMPFYRIASFEGHFHYLFDDARQSAIQFARHLKKQLRIKR